MIPRCILNFLTFYLFISTACVVIGLANAVICSGDGPALWCSEFACCVKRNITRFCVFGVCSIVYICNGAVFTILYCTDPANLWVSPFSRQLWLIFIRASCSAFFFPIFISSKASDSGASAVAVILASWPRDVRANTCFRLPTIITTTDLIATHEFYGDVYEWW